MGKLDKDKKLAYAFRYEGSLKGKTLRVREGFEKIVNGKGLDASGRIICADDSGIQTVNTPGGPTPKTDTRFVEIEGAGRFGATCFDVVLD